MLQRTLQALTLACGVMASLAMPTESRGDCHLFDCLFGKSPAPACATTYAPPYVPAPVYSAPTCQPCATAAPSCAPCAQSCQYMAAAPVVAYQSYAAYAPVVTAAYQPVVGSYAVTRYRPFLGTYETRLVPYTAYYAPSVAYTPVVGYTAAYAAYAPVASCGSYGCGSCGCGAGGCSSCGSCGGGSCGYSSCGSCETGACGSAIYGEPSSGCSSCNVASATVVTPPAVVGSSAPQPRTFEEKTNKPVPDKQLEPIPATDTKSSSLPSPTLPDPNSRTASVQRQLNSSARVEFVAQPVKPAPVEDDGGWHAAKE